jgi:hypothetical protein
VVIKAICKAESGKYIGRARPWRYYTEIHKWLIICKLCLYFSCSYTFFIAYMTPTISSNKSHARFCHLVVYIFGERFSSKTTTRISTYLCWPVGGSCTYPSKSTPKVTALSYENDRWK